STASTRGEVIGASGEVIGGSGEVIGASGPLVDVPRAGPPRRMTAGSVLIGSFLVWESLSGTRFWLPVPGCAVGATPAVESAGESAGTFTGEPLPCCWVAPAPVRWRVAGGAPPPRWNQPENVPAPSPGSRCPVAGSRRCRSGGRWRRAAVRWA